MDGYLREQWKSVNFGGDFGVGAGSFIDAISFLRLLESVRRLVSWHSVLLETVVSAADHSL